VVDLGGSLREQERGAEDMSTPGEPDSTERPEGVEQSDNAKHSDDAKRPAGGERQDDAERSSSGASPEAGEKSGEPAEEPAKRTGIIRYQDETTGPREPTLAERRAREQAARKAEEEEQARQAEQARRAKRRKRMLIGGSAVVGVAAVVAIGYAISQPDEVEARCVDDNNVVVDDNNCVTPAAASTPSSGGYYGGGLFPIFIGTGGRQYHYTYGGTGAAGQVATGGTTVPPKNATATTRSGRVVAGPSGDTGGSSIKRGGFGVGGSSAGKSGGS
jgi:hypothetical protein